MDLKKIRKKLSYLFGWLALKTCSLIIKFVPQRYLYGFAKNYSSIGLPYSRQTEKDCLG